MESQPQNPEFRNNPENFHPWISDLDLNYLHRLICPNILDKYGVSLSNLNVLYKK